MHCYILGKVIEIRESLTVRDLVNNTNVMLLNEKSLNQPNFQGKTLYVELNTFPLKTIEIRNTTEVAIL